MAEDNASEQLRKKRTLDDLLTGLVKGAKAAIPYAVGVAAAAGAWAYIDLLQYAYDIRQYNDYLLESRFVPPVSMTFDYFRQLPDITEQAPAQGVFSRMFFVLATGLAARSAIFTARKRRKQASQSTKNSNKKGNSTPGGLREYLCSHPGMLTATSLAGTAIVGLGTMDIEATVGNVLELHQYCADLIAMSGENEVCRTAMAWAETKHITNLLRLSPVALVYPAMKIIVERLCTAFHPAEDPTFWAIPAWWHLSRNQQEKAARDLGRFQQKREKAKRRYPGTRSLAELVEGMIYFHLGKHEEALKRISSAVEYREGLQHYGSRQPAVLTPAERRLFSRASRFLLRGRYTPVWSEAIQYVLDPENDVHIEHELDKLEAKRPNDQTILFLRYQLYAAQDREEDIVRVLEQVIDRAHGQHGLQVSHSIVRYQSEYLRWQFATKVGKETDLRIEFRHTKDVRELAAGVPGMSIATPVAIVKHGETPYYFMKLERGRELASVTTGKQKLLETAARFNGVYHALVEPSMPPIDYADQLQRRIFMSGGLFDLTTRIFDWPTRRKLITAIEAIKQAYPSPYHVAQRDGHQQNYIVIDKDDHDTGSYHDVGSYGGKGSHGIVEQEQQQRLAAIDFGFSKVYRPEIDLVKLLEMGGGDVDGIQRDHVIAAYAEGFHDALPWSAMDLSQERLVLLETALTPLVFLSYACWSWHKPETATMIRTFHGNALQSMERMRTMFPTDYRRLKPAYEVLEEEIMKLSCPPSSAPSGNTALLD